MIKRINFTVTGTVLSFAGPREPDLTDDFIEFLERCVLANLPHPLDLESKILFNSLVQHYFVRYGPLCTRLKTAVLPEEESSDRVK